jgi:hypothetical protein
LPPAVANSGSAHPGALISQENSPARMYMPGG